MTALLQSLLDILQSSLNFEIVSIPNYMLETVLAVVVFTVYFALHIDLPKISELNLLKSAYDEDTIQAQILNFISEKNKDPFGKETEAGLTEEEYRKMFMSCPNLSTKFSNLGLRRLKEKIPKLT